METWEKGGTFRRKREPGTEALRGRVMRRVFGRGKGERKHCCKGLMTRTEADAGRVENARESFERAGETAQVKITKR